MSTQEPAVEPEEQVEEPAAQPAETEPESAEKAEPEPEKLGLEVEITDTGPCKKHLKVEVARADIDRQFALSLKEFRKDAFLPGFRTGRAPGALVERRYRKEVAGQVKQTLLTASMEQLSTDYKLNVITQPTLDPEAVELPDDGPMRFELDLEVQPEFALPAYKALTVRRPVRKLGEADVDGQLKSFLERYAQLVPKLEGAAEPGDTIVADLKFHKDGQPLNEAKEVQFRLQAALQFRDGRVPDLDKALVGAKAGDSRPAKAIIGSGSADPALRGQEVDVTFEVLDLKTLRLPEVDREFLDSIGFQDLDDLRRGLREALERRVGFQQRQAMRRQIVDQLIAEVPFDLPSELVTRQERTTLQRLVAELKQAGLTDADLRAREAQIRANAHESTLRSLKEFFLLSKIADAEGITIDEADLEHEIDSIADRSDESPRRVRARIEKEGLAEGMAQQILERKSIDRILEFVKIEDVASEEEKVVETLDESAAAAGSGDEPEAGSDADAPAGEPTA